MFHARAREHQIAPNLASVRRLRGDRVVLVEQTAQAVAAPDALREGRRGRRRFCERRTLLERAVRAVLVVMPDVSAYDLLQMATADDQEPVETFAPQASHPALGVRLRPWRPHRRPNETDALGAEDLIEAARERAVAVAHEEAYRLLALGERVGCTNSIFTLRLRIRGAVRRGGRTA